MLRPAVDGPPLFHHRHVCSAAPRSFAPSEREFQSQGACSFASIPSPISFRPCAHTHTFSQYSALALHLALSKVNDNVFAKQRHDTSGPPPIQHKHLKKHAAAHALKSVPKPDSEPAKDAAKQTMTVGYEPVAVPNYMRPTKASQSDSVYSTVGVERNRSFSHSYQASWWC